jgi:predicted nucleic acid-binding protein
VIVVDSSVWIDFLNGQNRLHVRQLRAVLGTHRIIVGDLMLCEVLQGLDSDRAAREVELLLRRFEIVPMAGDGIAVLAARNSVSCAGAASLFARRSTSSSALGASKTVGRCSTMTAISALWRDIWD